MDVRLMRSATMYHMQFSLSQITASRPYPGPELKLPVLVELERFLTTHKNPAAMIYRVTLLPGTMLPELLQLLLSLAALVMRTNLYLRPHNISLC